ncbi:unnamed protein product [Tilletia laevis]|nr:unnamed protein product [Tilletia laevis]
MYWYRSHATQKWGNNTLNMPLKGYLLQRGGQEMDKHRFEALREDAKDKCHQYLAGLPDLPSQYKYKRSSTSIIGIETFGTGSRPTSQRTGSS